MPNTFTELPAVKADDSVTLGLYTFDHLGDCLCVTPLPRLLRDNHSGATDG